MDSIRWSGPRRSVEALVARHGPQAVVAVCLDLLAGRSVDGQLVVGLGGPPARWAVDGSPSGPDYWLRVWALRGLLWHWDESATAAVTKSLADEAWRVREMALKVVARHRLESALDVVVRLRHDRSARVRTAAERAVVRLTANVE